MDLTDQLFSLQDTSYRDFHSRLMPTVDKSRIIGVRTPALRNFAKSLTKEQAFLFMSALPHYYYEENNLHAFLIERITDFDECITELDRFLPYVDNWATCDMMRPKIFKKHTDGLLPHIKLWLESEHIYTVRFAIEMLMVFYSDEKFHPVFSDMVSSVRSDEYYVKMMVAWYFATLLSKHYIAVLPYIEQARLDKWTHNKAIQKAVESYRITSEQKAFLKTLKLN
ncbi:MAG: DNA alkylation repair protein [Ruminococcaceae bacterium]|nr:DNA alkylation repair protein [Oscillospiraceae bacterium]